MPPMPCHPQDENPLAIGDYDNFERCVCGRYANNRPFARVQRRR